MHHFPEILYTIPPWFLWSVFLVQNIMIVLGVLVVGNRIQQKPIRYMFVYSFKQYSIASITCLINTIFTYVGFWAWKHSYITISIDISMGQIIVDTLVLLMSMDLLMYLSHYFVHKTFLHKYVHELHHEAINPEPIDLFILHPLETIGFVSLWFFCLFLFTLNIWAIILFSILNVLFGMIGHLGMEPLSERTRQHLILKYLGTSTFHHNHHKDELHNFGFYTNIWDRLFGTYTR